MRGGMLTLAPETPRQEEVVDLIRRADANSARLYPPESNHPLDVDGLCATNVRFLLARLDGRAVGCGAIVLGRRGEAEIKRMFVHEDARGRGVGRALLAAVEDAARREGVRLLLLETGTLNGEALGLYGCAGYRQRGPFGSYGPDPLSVFMSKALFTDEALLTVESPAALADFEV